MSNPVREWLSANIGQELVDSPSPVGRWFHAVLREVGENTLTADYTIRPEMLNPVGLLHGGMIAAMMDDMIGATIFALGRPDFYTTVDLSVDYFAAARDGQVVTARTRLVKPGQQVIYAECDLLNDAGRLLARGRTNLLRLERKDKSTE